MKNNNLAAKRAKVKKDLDERIKQLGEKLYPLMTHGMSLTVKGLELLISFTTKYGEKIVWLTSILGFYWVVMKKNAIQRKIEEALILRAISLGLAETNGVKALSAAKLILTGSIKKGIAALKAFGILRGLDE